MKYKVLKPWEVFWKRTFNYIIDNELEPFDVLVYLVMTPTIFHKNNKKLNKSMDKMQQLLNVHPSAETEYSIPAYYLVHVFRSYVEHRRLPVSNYQGLIYMYNSIMHDYKNCDMSTITWNVLEKDEGIEGDEIVSRCCFVIYHILHEDEAEDVRKLLEFTRKEEDEIKTTRGVDVVVDGYLSKGKTYSYLQQVLKEYGMKYENDIMPVAKAIGGEIVENEFIAPKELAEFYYTLVLEFEHRINIVAKYKNLTNVVKKRYDKLRNAYAGDMRFMDAEREALIEKLNKAKNKKRVVYIDNEDKYKAEIQSLKAQYNSRIRELQKQIEDLKSMVSTITTKEDELLKPVKLPKMVDVVYFALEDPQLDSYISQYNVTLKHLSPLTAPKSVPDLQIVFNIDVASHKVWNKIKDKKPLIISGSNKEIIATKITTWLSK